MKIEKEREETAKLKCRSIYQSWLMEQKVYKQYVGYSFLQPRIMEGSSSDDIKCRVMDSRRVTDSSSCDNVKATGSVIESSSNDDIYDSRKDSSSMTSSGKRSSLTAASSMKESSYTGYCEHKDSSSGSETHDGMERRYFDKLFVSLPKVLSYRRNGKPSSINKPVDVNPAENQIPRRLMYLDNTLKEEKLVKRQREDSIKIPACGQELYTKKEPGNKEKITPSEDTDNRVFVNPTGLVTNELGLVTYESYSFAKTARSIAGWIRQAADISKTSQ